MKNENLFIDNLLKVTLVLETGNKLEPSAEPKTIDFIYGVAACGITPFEKLLYQKQAGDELTVAVNLHQSDEYFGPLSPGILSWLPIRGELDLKVGVQSVSTPENREIVKAMATGGGCGDDCDCGCGC